MTPALLMIAAGAPNCSRTTRQAASMLAGSRRSASTRSSLAPSPATSAAVLSRASDALPSNTRSTLRLARAPAVARPMPRHDPDIRQRDTLQYHATSGVVARRFAHIGVHPIGLGAQPRDERCGALERLRCPAEQHQVHLAPRQRPRRRPADAAAGTGEQHAGHAGLPLAPPVSAPSAETSPKVAIVSTLAAA